jgi:hypothetical protein
MRVQEVHQKYMNGSVSNQPTKLGEGGTVNLLMCNQKDGRGLTKVLTLAFRA